MLHLTKPDAVWLAKLLEIAEYVLKEDDFGLLSDDDEETIKIAGEIIRSINK